MSYHQVTCPACQAKLKYRSARTHGDCPVCHTRFSIDAQPSPAQSPIAEALDFRSNLPETSSPTSSISNRLVVGVAIGAMITVAILGSVMLLIDSDGQQSVEANQTFRADQAASSGEIVAHAVDAASAVEPEKESIIPQMAASIPTVAENDLNLKQIDTAPSLRYRWSVGQQFTYDFSFIANPESGQRVIEGACSYRVARIIPPSDGTANGGSGTAFVVAADGYLVTCAHVVKDAELITIKLGERVWTAEIVAYDELQDIALLRVKASNLPTLPLAESTQVELAQDVRVVGFPLTDMLGKGIKITRGSVAGMPETNAEGTRQFQVDATINQGNSGGPLIDAQGRVIGVASQYLTGYSLSDVGLAVPIDEVRKMLERVGVRPTGAKDSTPLSGPELARLVTPSVAYVEVRLTAAAYQDYQVDYGYQLKSQSFPPNPPHFGDGQFHPGVNAAIIPETEKGTITVDRQGEVTEYKGEVALPFSHFMLGKLFLEDVTSGGKSTWASTDFTIFKAEESQLGQDIHSRFRQEIRSRFPEPHFLPSPFEIPQQETKEYSVLVQTQYEITEETAEKLTVTKSYEYHTLDDEKPPRMTQTGTGTFVFDKQLGLPVKSEFSASSSERGTNGKIITVPYMLSYTLRDSNTPPVESNLLAALAYELGRSKAKESERPYRAITGTPPASRLPTRRETLDPERIAQLIEELEFHVKDSKDSKSLLQHDPPTKSHEISQLADSEFDADNQKQVATIFLHFAFTGDTFEQGASIRGLRKWAQEDSVPKMIELLTTDVEGIDWPERQDLIEALGRFPSPAVYQAVASRLAHSPEDHEAKEVLIAFGSDAEKAVANMLDSKSEDARDAAAEILEEIGTRRSLSALNKAASEEPDYFTKRSMKRAIEAIHERR